MRTFMKASFLMACLLMAFIGYSQSADNVFLQSDFWKSNPSLEEIKQKTQEGHDPLAFNQRKFNGAVYAILNENVSMDAIQYLMELESIDINELTHDGRTYIHWAALRGRTEVVKYLTSIGVSPTVVDDHGYTALNFAANAGRNEKDLYEFLLANGASLEDTNHHGASTILLLTPQQKSFEMVDYLLSKGASLDAKDQDGSGLFYYTARRGNTVMMDILIEKGLDYKGYNEKGANAMIAAASGGRRANGIEVFKYLEEKGVDVNVTTKEGVTPLIAIAGSTKDPEVIDYFMAKGVNINAVDDAGNNALIAAAARNNLEMIKLITSKTKDINAANKNGQTALTKAVASNSAEVVQFLINEGAKSDILDAEGNSLASYLINSYSPRSADAFKGKLEILKVEKIKFDQKQEGGNTILHLAAEENDLFLIKTALGLGIDVNAANDEGTTAIQIAAMKASDLTILQFLLESGADKSVKTDFEETVYDLASENELLSANNVDIEFLK